MKALDYFIQATELGSPESPADIFLQLWQEVQRYDWLDRPENLIHSTVLRATADAFRVNHSNKGPDEVMSDPASDPILAGQRV